MAESALTGLPHSLSFVRTALALERTQWLPVGELNAIRLGAVQATLDHASTHCPYYVDTLRPILDRMGPLRSLEQLAELPVVTRGDVRKDSLAMIDRRRRTSELRRDATGGTTGTPMPFYTDADYRLHSRALVARVYRTMGRGAFSRTVLMAGSPIDAQRWTDARRQFLYRVRRTSVVPAFSLSSAGLPGLVQSIRRIKPAFLMCYTSSLRLLARYCLSTGESLRIPAVVPLAELVTEMHREEFREAFGAETLEVYGAREATGMAVECRIHSGLHVQEDAFHLEFTRSGAPVPAGTAGEILVTDLVNRTMPLIRYQIGDVGQAQSQPCRCGRSFGLMRVTHGRILDVIVTPDGTLLPGEYFPHLFKEVDRDVKTFQVWQPALDRLEISMVVRDGADGAVEDYLAPRIAAKLGDGVQIRFHRVTELSAESSGKWRPTRSDVPLPW